MRPRSGHARRIACAWVLTQAPVAWACPDGAAVPLAELVATARAATAAYDEGDLEGLHQGTAMAEQQLPCVDALLAPYHAADLHRMQLRAAFSRADEQGTRRAYQALLAIDIDYLPRELQPGSPLFLLYEQARSQPAPAMQPVPRPTGAEVFVDGAASASRSIDYPAVLQLRDADGTLAWTGYLHGDEPLPAAVFPAPEVTVASAEVGRGGSLRRWAVGTSIAAGALLAVNSATRVAYASGGSKALWVPNDVAFVGWIATGSASAALWIGVAAGGGR